MNTRQYYYISTIANYGNLSHAAQALHISPSALSKFLTECERIFGLTLFLRYNRRLYPTAAGHYVIDCAQKILDEKNRMLLTMKEVSGGAQERIRLATAPNRGAIIYSKIYNQFSRRFPGISLSLTELYAAEQPGAIARGFIDLALGAGANSTEVTDIPIAHEELLVSLPVSHPLAGQERIRLKDLRDTPFVLQGRQHSIHLLADQLFLEAGFDPVVAFESSDVILLDSMMHQAVGAGLVSKAHVFPCPELSYRPLEPPVYQTLHLRYPLGHTLTEPERYLAGLLASERLADPRYQATDDPLVQSLLQNAASPAAEDTGPAQEKAASGTQDMQEVNLDSKVMEYLISIVEEQSLSKAADKHFLAQSALSRHLHSVEAMVATPLFSREHNRLRPTSAGAVFVNSARNILRIEKEMFDHTRSYQKGHSGSLYISCDHLFAQVLREQTVPQFRALHPDIELVITEENQEGTLEALINASADIGVFLSISREHPLLHCDIISMTEMVYCFASDACPLDWTPGSPLPERFFPRPQLMAPSGSTLYAEQTILLDRLAGAGGFTTPRACEAQTSVLRKLANLGVADSVLPLNLIERRNHDHCAAFEPPCPLYLLLSYHMGRTLPSVTQELVPLIHKALSDVLAIPARG